MPDLEVVHQVVFKIREFRRNVFAKCDDCASLIDYTTQGDIMEHAVWHVKAANVEFDPVKAPSPYVLGYRPREIRVQVLRRTSDGYHYAQIVK